MRSGAAALQALPLKTERQRKRTNRCRDAGEVAPMAGMGRFAVGLSPTPLRFSIVERVFPESRHSSTAVPALPSAPLPRFIDMGEPDQIGI